MHRVEADLLGEIEQLRLGQAILRVSRGTCLKLQRARHDALDRRAVDRDGKVR